MGKPESTGSSVSRRDFLRVGSLSVVGWSVAEPAVRAHEWASRRRCIFVMMNGGVSQTDTFDPKPSAEMQFRGPTRATQTVVPGVQFSDSLPGLAERADRFAVVRSFCHDDAALHQTGMQLMQTGRLSAGNLHYPHVGNIAARALRLGEGPHHVVLPGPFDCPELAGYVGQGESFLEGDVASALETDSSVRRLLDRRRRDWRDGQPLPPVLHRYGDSEFGRRMAAGFGLVEAGVRFVTINLFDELHGRRTWDAHGHAESAPGTVFDYRDYLCPQFDKAMSALLDDLYATGLINDTLVVAVSEMGRHPMLNSNSGRDHWTKGWSGILAGAGIQGGAVLGATDSRGGEVVDRPVAPAELVATVYNRLGLDHRHDLLVDGDRSCPLVDAEPLAELV